MIFPELRTEFCQNEQFSGVCGENEVVIIESARYGRMQIGRCVKTDFGFIGCFNDILHVSIRLNIITCDSEVFLQNSLNKSEHDFRCNEIALMSHLSQVELGSKLQPQL